MMPGEPSDKNPVFKLASGLVLVHCSLASLDLVCAWVDSSRSDVGSGLVRKARLELTLELLIKVVF